MNKHTDYGYFFSSSLSLLLPLPPWNKGNTVYSTILKVNLPQPWPPLPPHIRWYITQMKIVNPRSCHLYILRQCCLRTRNDSSIEYTYKVPFSAHVSCDNRTLWNWWKWLNIIIRIWNEQRIEIQRKRMNVRCDSD